MQTFTLDLSAWGVTPVLNVKQGDVGRKFKAVLADNGAAYQIPFGAQFSVWYSGRSGQGNFSHVGERSAFTVSGNEVTVELIAQMLTNPGTGLMCLVLNSTDGSQLGLWNIPYLVEPVPGMGSEEATAYYTALAEAARQAASAAAKFQTDPTLSIAGVAADAAAVGSAIANAGAGQREVEDSSYPGCYYRMVGDEKEWINPPMVDGVEYRTTERYDGQAVYTKLVYFGLLPDTATACTNEDTLPANAEVIYIKGTGNLLRGAGYSDLFRLDGVADVWANTDPGGGYISIKTSADMSDYTARVTVKYVKE